LGGREDESEVSPLIKIIQEDLERDHSYLIVKARAI
jgi:hypothetical protein